VRIPAGRVFRRGNFRKAYREILASKEASYSSPAGHEEKQRGVKTRRIGENSANIR
jgi:hypothetical protein